MSRRRTPWIILILLILAAAGGGAYYYYFHLRPAAQAATAPEPTISTTRASRGDLIITAAGSGTLIPADEVSLGFQTSGTLAEVLVKVGDVVQAGQVLARLDDTDVQREVAQAEISHRLAQLSLEALTREASAAEIAAAQASLASAKANLAKLTAGPDSQEVLAARENLKSARQKLDALLAGPDATEVKNAQYALETAKNNLWSQQLSRDAACGMNDHVKCNQAQAAVGNAEAAVRKAQEELDAVLAGPSADEIADARARVASAQAQLDSLLAKPGADEIAAAEAQVAKAQGDLDALLAGADATELEKAQLSLEQARLNLQSARRKLDQLVLKAPIAGTVTAVNARVGDSVGSGAIITLADLSQPRLKFWVEEADMASAAPGNAVNIVFEALPDYTFRGEILSVDPMLVTVSNLSAVQAYASIDLTQQPVRLFSAMNAEVEVVAGEARNAVLVPVQALRELAPDQYAVMVVADDGTLALRPVTVGLKDLVSAEIRAGLAEGEQVVLAQTQAASSQTTSARSPFGQMAGPEGGGPMFFGGGPP